MLKRNTWSIKVDYRVIGIILRSIGVVMLSHFTCDTDVVVHGLFCKIINA